MSVKVELHDFAAGGADLPPMFAHVFFVAAAAVRTGCLPLAQDFRNSVGAIAPAELTRQRGFAPCECRGIDLLRRDLESDDLRREGRRPSIPLSVGSDSGGDWQLPGNARAASSIARSGERHGLEEKAIVTALREQISRWRKRGDWTKLKCTELLFVRGWANKDVATQLDITEQQVANFKFDFLARLRSMIRRQGLSEDVFPELYD